MTSPIDRKAFRRIGESLRAVSTGVWIKSGSMGWSHSGNTSTATVWNKAEGTASAELDAPVGYRLKHASYTYLQAKTEDAKRFQRVLKKPKTLTSSETIVFQDETGFTLHPRLSRGWVKCGRRLRVATTSQHQQRLNISGWVAPLLGRFGMVHTQRGDRNGFIDILTHVYKRLKGYTIWLYVDRARWHKGESVDMFVKTHH